MTFRDSLRFTGLQIVSLITGAMAVVVGVVYLDPDLVRRNTLPPGQTSIVMALESLGPFWPVLFWIVGGSIIIAVTARQRIITSHVVAMAGWGFYGGAIFAGALLSRPPTSIIVGILAMGLAAIHLGLIMAHQDAGEGRARKK